MGRFFKEPWDKFGPPFFSAASVSRGPKAARKDQDGRWRSEKGFGKGQDLDLVAVDPPAKSLTFGGCSWKTQLDVPKS